MLVDPSGRGKDETGSAVVKMLHGILHYGPTYVSRRGTGTYADTALDAILNTAKQQSVNAQASGQMTIRAPTSTARSSGMQKWSDTSLAERASKMKM